MATRLGEYRRKRDFTRTPEIVSELDRLEAQGGGELGFEDGHTLDVTHLGRVVFPEVGVTKGELMRYYDRVAPTLLPLLRDRPLALKRYPKGLGGPSFHQHEPTNWPDGVRTAKVRLEDGTTHPRLVGGDLQTLLYTVQLGAISVHPWHARVGSLFSPDWIVIDLDPSPGVRYERVVEVALTVRKVLSEEGLDAQPKTSGATGLHILAPLAKRATWKTAAATAERVAKAVVAALPSLTTLARDPAKRPPGTVYVDFLQNARGKTAASAWSVRATPTATVSVPLSWEEVEPGLDPRSFTMDAALQRLEKKPSR